MRGSDPPITICSNSYPSCMFAFATNNSYGKKYIITIAVITRIILITLLYVFIYIERNIFMFQCGVHPYPTVDLILPH